MRALVVGAGSFGVTAALALRRRGASVQMLDPCLRTERTSPGGPRPHPDASSTDISKVIRADYGKDTFYAALMERALEGWRAWNARWPRPLYHEDGFLLLAGAPMADGGFEHDSFQTLRARGHALRRLDADALAALAPAWAYGRYPDGYLNPAAGWAESGEVVAALLREADAAGIGLVGGAMDGLIEADDRVVGVRTVDGARVTADVVIVAAGCWTPALLPELSEIMWATGQPVFHLRVTEPHDWRPPRFFPWAADIGRTGWYGFPAKPDGILKIANHGPGVRLDPRAPRVFPEGAEASLRRFLGAALPALVDAPVAATRLCVYCDTFDGDFWIHQQRPGLVVAAGGSGHGFKFAPLLGDMIADAAEGGDAPERFRGRSRGAIRTEDARFDGSPLTE